MPTPEDRQPVFYYDLASPCCYLVSERIMSALPVVPEWEPVLAAELDGPGSGGKLDRELVERRVADLGLQPLRWPSRWPPDPRQAMLAATYAKRVGRAVAFSLAAFRQQFAGGRDIGDQATVLIAAAACEMHPTAVLKGIGLRSTAGAARQATERARAAGIRQLPAIQWAGTVFTGDRAVELAMAELGEGHR